MRILLISLISLTSLSSLGVKGLSPDIIFSAKVSYLPSSNCRYEYYIQKGQTVKHNYEKESNNCWDLPYNKGRKEGAISLINISKFIEDLNKRDSLKIYFSEEIQYLLTNELLTSSNYFKNDSLTFVFSKFEKEYYKPKPKNFWSIPNIEGIQIDGNWLDIKFIQNQDTLLSVYKSISGTPRVSEAKSWLILYFIYTEYNLFQSLQIQEYMSKENFIYLMKTYLEVMNE